MSGDSSHPRIIYSSVMIFFFNDTATTEIYTLSLHDALPISNGVRVVLKPTTFKQDEILFRAVSPGGTSLASDEDFVPAETADEVVAQGGLGTLRSSDVNKILAGASVCVRADIGET